MSTILRALQKVETESTEDVQQFGPIHPVKASNTFNRRFASLWYRRLGRRFLWIGLSVAIVCLMAILAINIFGGDNDKTSLSQLSPNQESETPPPSSHVISPTKPNKDDQSMQTLGPTRPKSFAPKRNYDPNYKPQRFADKVTPKTFTKKETVNAPRAQVEPPLETEKILPEEVVDESLSIESEDTLFKESAKQEDPIEIFEDDPEELRYAQVDILENGNLELQAISWSKTPSERIAVINNEIMHQGQSLKGYKIIYIGPDDIVVEKGGKQGKIIFMIR